MSNPKRVRNHTRKLYHEQGGLCYYCGTDKMYLREDVTTDFHKANRRLRATFDHIVPKAKGGTYRKENGVCACSYCNSRKGDMPFKKFIVTYDAAMTRAIIKVRSPKSKKSEYLTPRQERIIIKRKAMFIKNSYAIAWFAMHLDQAVTQVFDEYVYHTLRRK